MMMRVQVYDLILRLDADNDGDIDMDEMFRGLLDFGLELSTDDLRVVFRHFDSDGSGKVCL